MSIDRPEAETLVMEFLRMDGVDVGLTDDGFRITVDEHDGEGVIECAHVVRKLAENDVHVDTFRTRPDPDRPSVRIEVIVG